MLTITANAGHEQEGMKLKGRCCPAISFLLLAPALLNAVELKPETLEAWTAYVQAAKAQLARRAKGQVPFLWVDEDGERARRVRAGDVLKVIYYGAKNGFWVYLPTNGRLMRPEVIDWILDAGVATINLAVDAVDEKPGLPKALNPIRSNFEYLVRRQYAYGATVFFNINICRNNLEDVKALTEIAHANGIATDYHINEEPMIEQDHFSHMEGNPTFVRQEDWPQIDEASDWLIEKNRSGYKMVNSTSRLADMKRFMRGELQKWDCRAGQNSLIIRVDGTLAPCAPRVVATVPF